MKIEIVARGTDIYDDYYKQVPRHVTFYLNHLTVDLEAIGIELVFRCNTIPSDVDVVCVVYSPVENNQQTLVIGNIVSILLRPELNRRISFIPTL